MPTIFYAWQSDTPNNVNRGFIRDALEKAIALVKKSLAIEDALDLDHDTQGVPGSPPIAETILKKITACDIFVGDVTLVATVDDLASSKRLPNANVLVELGYCLGQHGSGRLIGVMNSHFGAPRDLPFDMAHRRYPIQYQLAPDADPDERSAVKAALIKSLSEAISSVITTSPKPSRNEINVLGELESEFGSFVPDQRLLRIDGEEIFWRNQPQVFLRVIPQKPLANRSSVQLRELARHFSPPLHPLASLRHRVQLSDARTDDGYLVVCIDRAGEQRRAICVTKLFNDGQIWGVDQRLLRENENLNGKRIIPSGALRSDLESSLQHYLKFYADSLRGEFPVRVVAGLEFIDGLPLVVSNDRYSEPSIQKRVAHATDVISADVNPAEVLRPLYEKLWDACGEALSV